MVVVLAVGNPQILGKWVQGTKIHNSQTKNHFNYNFSCDKSRGEQTNSTTAKSRWSKLSSIFSLK